MVNPLERLWKDRCTVYQQTKVTDPGTKLTDFVETVTIQDQPCKLSFERLTSSGGDDVAIITQSIKLFLSPDITIPPGSKIVVKRFNAVERELIYSKSGESGIFTNHQEILLEPFRRYA